jgi:hypothetical protein
VQDLSALTLEALLMKQTHTILVSVPLQVTTDSDNPINLAQFARMSVLTALSKTDVRMVDAESGKTEIEIALPTLEDITSRIV